jgi:excisionase family DNA binding protein
MKTKYVGSMPANEFWTQLRHIVLTIVDEKLTEKTSRRKESASFSPNYYSTKQVMDLFKISKTTVRNWKQDGKLKPYKVGNKVYYKCSDIDTLMKKSIIRNL